MSDASPLAPAGGKKLAPKTYAFKDFLEGVPPGRQGLVTLTFNQGGVELPLLRFDCQSTECAGARTFEPITKCTFQYNELNDWFITYRCRNCKASTKTFAVRAFGRVMEPTVSFIKYGEIPSFGPRTPARIIKLIGPDKDAYLKGRRCENQDLGIAAFGYYRRVVENQKNRILDAILRVATKLNASKDVLGELEDAKKETQFSTAVGAVKHGIPQTLLVNGHNPLTLLHRAMSEGLHAQTDQECLELATSIRVVLTDLAEKLAAALNDEAELNNAVTRLLKGKQ